MGSEKSGESGTGQSPKCLVQHLECAELFLGKLVWPTEVVNFICNGGSGSFSRTRDGLADLSVLKRCVGRFTTLIERTQEGFNFVLRQDVRQVFLRFPAPLPGILWAVSLICRRLERVSSGGILANRVVEENPLSYVRRIWETFKRLVGHSLVLS